MAARLREEYDKTIKKKLMDKLKFKSIMQVPKLEKIVLNVGMGDGHANRTA